MCGKRLGQHFMTDERVLEREVEYAKLSRNDIVLEIGPGTGNLTKHIVKKAKKVYAIEKDRSLARFIEMSFPEVEVIAGDALDVEWPHFDKMVSNIPYKISSPLTFRLLEHDFRLAVLTYQEEFAERLVAYAGDFAYSRLSVMAYYRAEMEILEKIPRSAFRPQPRVDSAMVKIVPRKGAPFRIMDERLFEDVVRTLFSARRKTVRAALRQKYGKLECKYGSMRVEELTPEEIGEIANIIYDIKKK